MQIESFQLILKCNLLFSQKYKDPNAAAEMNSLKYAQKMIDLRLSYMQNNKRDTDRDSTSNLPIIPLDELLNKNLTLFYYLDYLSVLNLQRYVLFYLSARGTIIVRTCISTLQSVVLKYSFIDCYRMEAGS